MKFPQLLVFVSCSIAIVLSESTESNEQLLARASAQLERLAPYRRTSPGQGTSDEQWQVLENATKDPGKKKLDERQMAFEIYRILPDSMQKDIARRVGGNEAVVELLTNPKYMAMMQERIKRSGSKGGYGTKRDGYTYDGYEAPPDGHPPSGYGGYAPEHGQEHYGAHPPSQGSDSGGIIQGSGSLISGIAKGIIGGLVSASSSASKGSSSMSASASGASSSSSSSSSDNKHPEYGPPTYSYDHKEFDVWDFKKAIISTLMQAVKAISGGVIALKGQLIKGSGYLVSSKGKMITSTGDAITSLGRNIAKSTVQHPHHHGYTYDHPPESGHDSYDGPPPGIHEEFAGPGDEYHGSSNYESPSDDDDHAGLLIVKPAKPEDHDDHHEDLDSHKPPTEDSHDGPQPSQHDKEVENSVAGNPDSYQNHDQGNHLVESHYTPDHPPGYQPSSYDVPLHQHSLDDHKKGQEYVVYPPSDSAISHLNPLSIQQSVEYPPIHIRYTLPDKGSLDLPHEDPSNNDLSVYSSLMIKPGPDSETIKISAVNHAGGFQLPKLQTHGNFHDFPSLPNAYSGASLQGPLKIPLLNPYMLASQWPNQGLHQSLPGFDMHSFYRRKSLQRRRSVNDVARRMRLHRV